MDKVSGGYLNNKTHKSLNWLIIYSLCLAPVLFLLIWIMLGKPAYPWDSAWYRSIVDYGYTFNGDITKQQNVAFLPGYPIIIKIIAIIFGFNSVVAQQVVGFLCYLSGSWLFYVFFSLRIGEYKSAAVVIIWSLMPFSIYFMNGYSETVLFVLVGAFFYFLEKGSVISASFMISYGLITRPQAIAMLPVLFYFLYQIEYKKGELSWHQSLGSAGIKLIGLAPIVMLFPVIWTLYCYYCFGDPLIYKNMLFAWDFGKHLSIAQKLSAAASSMLSAFNGLQYSHFLLYKSNFITLSPHQFFSFLFFLGSLLTPVFIIMKYYDLFIFNLSIIIFWILASTIPNGGRHISLMFSIPFAVVIGLATLQQLSNNITILKNNILLYIMAIFWGFLFLMLFGISIIHFIWYAISYLNGIWIS